jgi:hypothetical protein
MCVFKASVILQGDLKSMVSFIVSSFQVKGPRTDPDLDTPERSR